MVCDASGSVCELQVTDSTHPSWCAQFIVDLIVTSICGQLCLMLGFFMKSIHNSYVCYIAVGVCVYCCDLVTKE